MAPSGFEHVNSSSSSLRFPEQYLEDCEPENMPSSCINLIWKRLRSVFTTPQTIKDCALNIAAVSDHNTNIIGPSEPQREKVHPDVSSTSEDEEPILEMISDSSSDVRPELSPKLLVTCSHIDPVDEQLTSDCDSVSDNADNYVQSHRDQWGITLPSVTISAFTETGQAEGSINVPNQRSYTGRRPIIPSSLADTPCAALGIQGILDRLNVTLGILRTLDTPSLLSLLKECINKNYDFGTVYGLLRVVWNTQGDSNIRDKLRRREEEDREMRQKALVGNRIINPCLKPRCVWDLYSNRVVPYWIARTIPTPISHAWADEDDRADEWTPINGKEWPVPIPKDANLNLIRIEILNLDVEYPWLDVLCLRQKNGIIASPKRMHEGSGDLP